MNNYNVVVMCLDTFRWDLLNHRGPWPVSLPNLDAIRQESVEFMNAFGEAQPTIPIRRAYFTGHRSFPWRFNYDTEGLWPTGRGWHKIPPEQTTLAERLLDHGYHTGLISDTYHMFKPTMNFTRGFLSYEFVRGYESDNFRGGVLSPDALKPFVRDPVPANHPVLMQYLLNVRDRKDEEDWLTAQVFRRASHWVEDYKTAEPFMLWIDSFGPHEPWDPPRSYVDPVYGKYEGIEFIYPYGMKEHQLAADEIERIRHLYLGYLTFVDHWVGQFTESLKSHGLWDKTIIMIVSDHGTELSDHGRFSKHQAHLYAHNTQLIWAIRHPAQGIRKEVPYFVQSHDLYPTICGLLGIDSGSVAGQNVWPIGEKIQNEPRDWIITGWGNYASVRDVEWNYIVNFEDPSADERLYHLVSDPLENVDVVQTHHRVAEKMRCRLEEFLEQSLPAKLDDKVRPGVAPIRRYYQSSVSQDKADSGFV